MRRPHSGHVDATSTWGISLEVHKFPGAGAWLIGGPACSTARLRISFLPRYTQLPPPPGAALSSTIVSAATRQCAPAKGPQAHVFYEAAYLTNRERENGPLSTPPRLRRAPAMVSLDRPANLWIPHGEGSTLEAWDFAVASCHAWSPATLAL